MDAEGASGRHLVEPGVDGAEQAVADVGKKGLAGRLDRLVLTAKPGRCVWHGGRCVRHALVGDGSDDPPLPELPEVCPDCGRPALWRVVVLAGVDVARV